MPRTATAKLNLKPNEFAGIRQLLHGCVQVINGIAEMFPEHTTRGYGTVTGQDNITQTKGRGRGNWKVETGGKKVA